MDLSIIIPCRGEARNIEICVLRILKSCSGAEVLVVDSGIDETQILVERLAIDHPNIKYILCQPDRGKGDAIRQGIAKSTRSVIAQIDADLQFFPEDLPNLIKPICDGHADMMLGSRFLSDSQASAGNSLKTRSFGNLLISRLCSIFFKHKITDALAGMKAWRREVTNSFELTRYTFSYEVELFAKALAQGWRVQDVPVSYALRENGVSKVAVLKVGLMIINDIFQFKFFPQK